MTSSTVAVDADQLQQVAVRLGDIARTVGDEAMVATAGIRAVAQRARETAEIASQLDAIAQTIERNVAKQLATLAEARRRAASNVPLLDTLATSADGIGSMSGLIAGIATRSRLLALNARIEAARSSIEEQGFAVVAGEMTALATQTWAATRDIEGRAEAITAQVQSAHAAFAAGAALVDHQERMVGEIDAASSRQRVDAAAVAALSSATLEGVEEAAEKIGRVASSANVLGVLARQVGRIADAA